MDIKIKKIIYYFIISIFLAILLISSYLQATYYKFSSNSVKKEVEIISSNEFEGRLAGTTGNNKAAQLIENTFKKYTLSPLNNSYRESFEFTSPIKNGTNPEMTIKTPSRKIKSYTYGVDFKEDFTNFKTSNVTFNPSDRVSIFSRSFTITHENKSFLFYVSFDHSFNFRSSFNADSPYEFSIAITTEVFNDILTALREGNYLYINLPYNLSKCTTSNIVGMIPGTSSSLPPLVLSAHFDHIGTDCLGNCYHGALDNASGTAFLLELSKSLSTFIKPKRDIIFVTFSGEEFGLIGSENFIENHKELLINSKVINFDMVGSANAPISLVNGTYFLTEPSASSSKLSNSLEDICLKKNISYVLSFQDCSDHASFTKYGIDSVTICNSDLSKIHTPKDTVNYIDESSINNIYLVAISEIYNDAYDQRLFLLYSPKLIALSLSCLIFMIAVPAIIKTKKNNIQN